MKHTCAVCWKQQDDHDGWHDHAEQEHGAVLDEFGFKECSRKNCLGVMNTNKLSKAVRGKVTVKPLVPVTGRDGTVYTPIRLPGA